jgi:hypothetical protein
MMLKLSTNTKIIFKNNLGEQEREIELFWGGFGNIKKIEEVLGSYKRKFN